VRGAACTALVVAVVVVWAAAAIAHAHGLAPIAVDVREEQAGGVWVRWTVTAQGAGMGLTVDGRALQLVLPSDCERIQATQSGLDTRFRRSTEHFHCPGGLAGRRVRVDGLSQSDQAVVLRADLAGQAAVWTHTLFGTHDAVTLPALARTTSESGLVLASRYVRVGVRHILSGFDHLIFVLCLALVAQRLRNLWWPVTAFTLAHSLTLALGALGFVRLPSAPVEACIALSVLWMAAAAVRVHSHGECVESSAGLTFVFGLLHGLGFAGALEDVGLRAGPFAWALVGFNVGVELGQLALIASLALVALLVSQARRYCGPLRRLPRASAELAGVVSGYWLVERVLQSVGLG